MFAADDYHFSSADFSLAPLVDDCSVSTRCCARAYTDRVCQVLLHNWEPITAQQLSVFSCISSLVYLWSTQGSVGFWIWPSRGYSLVVCVVLLQLLGSLLDDVLKSEVGTELFNKVERIRSLAQCAAQLANKHDSVRQCCSALVTVAGCNRGTVHCQVALVVRMLLSHRIRLRKKKGRDSVGARLRHCGQQR